MYVQQRLSSTLYFKPMHDSSAMYDMHFYYVIIIFTLKFFHRRYLNDVIK